MRRVDKPKKACELKIAEFLRVRDMLQKSVDSRAWPIPGRSYPTAFVTDVRGAVEPVQDVNTDV